MRQDKPGSSGKGGKRTALKEESIGHGLAGLLPLCLWSLDDPKHRMVWRLPPQLLVRGVGVHAEEPPRLPLPLA